MKDSIPTSRYADTPEAGTSLGVEPAVDGHGTGGRPHGAPGPPAGPGPGPGADPEPEPRCPADAARPPGQDAALLLLDARGRIQAATESAGDLFGTPVSALAGRSAAELFTDPGLWTELSATGTAPRAGRPAILRHGGAAVQLHCASLPADPADGPEGIALRYALHVMPDAAAERHKDEQALVRALFGQAHIGLAIHDRDLRVTRVNTDESFGAATSRSLDTDLVPEDAAAIEAALREAIEEGRSVVDVPYQARRCASPQTDRVVSLSVLPLREHDGRCRGAAAAFIDITEQHRTRQRRALVNRAAKRIGDSLDVTRCAEEVAALLVPEFADLAAVDLTEVVLIGEEPGDFLRGAPLRRVAVSASDGEWPAELYPLGADFRIRSMETHHLRKCSATVPDWDEMRAAFAGDSERSRLLLPEQARSFMVVPLHARGLVLGSLMLWRADGRPPFDQQDAELAEEIVSRAALGVDNARRYTRERRTAEALRRSLLPPAIVDVSAAEAAGTCLAAATTEGVGGTWFDVIPLSSSRIAFVVGDSAGHGLEATAATGRLRTAVRTLADLDLAPEELLSHLDDLVIRLTETDVAHAAPDVPGPSATEMMKGSTCLYAVYDPVTGQCTMASAGHPPPIVMTPDGRACVVDCEPGSPLGVSGSPFEPVEMVLEPGSLLACYSGKLLSHLRPSTDCLCGDLKRAAGLHRSPEGIGRETLARLVPEPPSDDITLLVTRLRGLPEDATAAWDFPPDPAMVTRARQAVTEQLTAWGLPGLVQTTELVASELVTNAIRYAGGPVHLRLIKDETLVCEVSDTTQTQPHLRRARVTDEGGRGLFLIHQLTHRWGSRYTASGKTIWTEQLLA